MKLTSRGSRPNFVFVGDDGTESALCFEAASGRIHAIAQYLRQKIPQDAAIGLMFRSEPNLVVNWIACVLAGLRPLIIQYPTKKQSYTHWADSVRNIAKVTALAAIIADDYCAGLGLDGMVATIPQHVLEQLLPLPPGPIVLHDFEILQLS